MCSAPRPGSSDSFLSGARGMADVRGGLWESFSEIVVNTFHSVGCGFFFLKHANKEYFLKILYA